MVWPVPGQCRLNAADTSRGQGGGQFGDRRTGGRTHEGIDIASFQGARVVAILPGTVTAIQPNPSASYGNQVILSVPGLGYFQYAHLNIQSPVPAGTRVQAGDTPGYVGRSGNVPRSADTHLHFEWRSGPGPFSSVSDPMTILPPCN